jgi:hypothetical protein
VAEAGGPAAMGEGVAAGTEVTAVEVAAETAAAGEPADTAVGAAVMAAAVGAMAAAAMEVAAAASLGIPAISCVTWCGPSTPSPSSRRISTRPPRAS